MPDVTVANLNMLYVRYVDRVEQEVHLPLGPLHVARSLEDAGFKVDFRDYQLSAAPKGLTTAAMGRFLDGCAPVLLVSCMANLLPFTLLALRSFKTDHPDVFVALGGVGPASVEERILELCPWIDAVGFGEGEKYVPILVNAAMEEKPALASVPSIVWNDRGQFRRNSPAQRLAQLDSLPYPAYHLVDVSKYKGINMLSSRGCPFPCTFCSVAPIWGRHPVLRSPESIVAEMRFLHDRHGAELFLFQDEYFVSSAQRVQAICSAIRKEGLQVRWKAFGRIDLTDAGTMEAMARAGCVEIRYGVESGSDKVLKRIRKGFDSRAALDVLSLASGIFPGVDAFYMWGFPFETSADFNHTMVHMLSARAMGVRILPSLLSYLPQTTLYEELKDEVDFEFCPELFPEYMLTGLETCVDGRMVVAEEHQPVYDFINEHPDVFPGFFHVDVINNVIPKYRMLQKFGFYSQEGRNELLGAEVECCGAHQPE